MTAAPEPRASVLGQTRGGFRKFRKKDAKLPQSSQASTGVWKISREETGPCVRLESMLKLALAFLFLVAIVGATADLARGRRPVLFA